MLEVYLILRLMGQQAGFSSALAIEGLNQAGECNRNVQPGKYRNLSKVETCSLRKW